MTTINLYNEDAFVQLDKLASNTVDLVFTSPNPPFYALQNNILDQRYIGSEPFTTQYAQHLVTILAKTKRVLKDTGSLWLHMTDFRPVKEASFTMVPEVTASRLLYEHEFILQTKAIWVREQRTPLASDKRFKTNWEHIYIFTKRHEPEYYFDNGGINLSTSIWNFPVKDEFEFPKGMVELAVATSSPPNGVVLDPFMGDGTAGEMALKYNRHFVGIEINPERCYAAQQKLQKLLENTNVTKH